MKLTPKEREIQYEKVDRKDDFYEKEIIKSAHLIARKLVQSNINS